MSKFSIFEYVNMFKARGWRLVFEYFVHNHLFDIFNKVDTHSWVPKKFEGDFIGDGEFYMATWARDIKRSTKTLIKVTDIDASQFNFYDLGCGKGKVLLVWKSMFSAMGFKPNLFGVEYDNDLIQVCRKNLLKLNYDDVSIIETDANKIQISTKNNIFFLYNPFGLKTLENFVFNNISNLDYVIYVNPKYSEELVSYGFEIIYEFESYRNGSTFKLLRKLEAL